MSIGKISDFTWGFPEWTESLYPDDENFPLEAVLHDTNKWTIELQCIITKRVVTYLINEDWFSFNSCCALLKDWTCSNYRNQGNICNLKKKS
jgi:hypothetical protein